MSKPLETKPFGLVTVMVTSKLARTTSAIVHSDSAYDGVGVCTQRCLELERLTLESKATGTLHECAKIGVRSLQQSRAQNLFS